MFVEICPQGDSIYSEIFQMCSCGPLRSQGILHQSNSGDWGVTACSGFPAGVPVSPDSLLLTRKDAWGHVGRKGGPRRTSEVTAHSRRGHRQGNTTQYSVTFKMINTAKWTLWKLSSSLCLNPWPHQSWNIWYCPDLKNQAEASQIK